MNGFQYKHGDRPLDGYTIERGIGRGGFGEVYYAVSDSGRECAIKAVQGYEQIELRGISQCMNLKSPHLVSIFDIRHNDKGRPFVIMEYVAGPSLRELLNDSPAGIGTQKAAFFLREIANGLTYLHDRGIVHRDLKPGNIFYEDGYVKIGDYGLSKAITPSRHSGQTITVGTVHYMAPEIGQGRYDRSIDIYALGCVLYELLTGQVPFFGASHGEILMKHLMETPDMSGIAEPFNRVICKAMTKNPADRYQTVQEMVEDVFGAEHIRESVSHFRPESLSMVADRAARKVTVGTGSSAQSVNQLGGPAPGEFENDPWGKFGRDVGLWGERMGEWGTHFGRRMAETFSGRWRTHEQPPQPDLKTVVDPLNRKQRNMLWLVTCMIMGAGAGLVGRGSDFASAGMVAVAMIAGGSKGLAIGYYRLFSRLRNEGGFARRLSYGSIGSVLAVGGALAAFLLVESSLGPRFDRDFLPTVVIVVLCLFLADWPRRMNPSRPERVSLDDAFSIGLGGLLAFVTDAGVLYTGGILAGISMANQALCPFNPAAAEQARHKRKPSAGHAAGGTASARRMGMGFHPRAEHHAARPQTHPIHEGAYPDQGVRLMPIGVRLVFLFVSIVVLALAATFFVHGMREEYFVMVALGMLPCSLFCLVKAVQRTFPHWWSSLIKPLILLACVELVFCSAGALATQHIYGDFELVVVFLTVFPALLFFVTLCITNRTVDDLLGFASLSNREEAVSNHNRRHMLLMAVVGLVTPLAGLHRVYVGKVGTGLIWICTWGLFGVGTLIDIVLIAAGVFTDGHGRRIAVWQGSAPVQRGGAQPVAMPDAPRPPGADVQASLTEEQQDNPPVNQQDGHAATVSNLSESTIARQRSNAALAFLGGLLIVIAFALGMAVAFRIPEMTAAGLFGGDFAEGLRRDVFADADWPRAVQELAQPVVWSLLALGGVLLMIARRPVGLLSMIRALVGVVGLMLALAGTVNSVRYAPQPGDSTVPDIVRQLRVDTESMAIAVVVLLVAVLVLYWPERRSRGVSVVNQQEGVR